MEVVTDAELRAVATLDHLMVRPTGGIGNRLRAVAAARRLTSLVGAECTIVWLEGNYVQLLALDAGVRVVAKMPAAVVPRLELPRFVDGGNEQNRVVPISEGRVLLVKSGFFFCAREEPLVTEAEVVGDWLPQPADAIRDAVTAFASDRFDGTVGIHIRQGDNGRRLVAPPIELFMAEAERVVSEGRSIFLAADSEHVETAMRARFGARIITWPKRWDLPHRWPRDPRHRMDDTPEIVTDFVDLQLLAACDHVIGWSKSSFSKIAAAYNGSPHCLLFEGPPLDPLGGRYTHADPRIRAQVLQNGDG